MRRSCPLVVLLALSIAAPPAQAQTLVTTRAVREAEALGPNPRIGQRVAVAGRVALGAGALDTAQLNIYVQDSAGVVFADVEDDTRTLQPRVGDSVRVTGIIEEREGRMVMDSASLSIVPAARVAPVPLPLRALVPSALANLESRLVVVEGFVASAHLDRGDHLLTIRDTVVEGNYVSVVSRRRGADLHLDRFSMGDRIRVTGILVRRVSPRTGITRFGIYPRNESDLVPLSLTARARSTLFQRAGVLLAITLVGVWGWRSQRGRESTRSRAEQALRDDAARYRSLVDQTPIGIVVHQKGNIVFANAAFRVLAGDDGTRTTDVLTLTDPDQRDTIVFGRAVPAAMPAMLRGQFKRLVRHDGSFVDVEVVEGPVGYEGRCCVQAILYDVSERTRAQRALAESEERLRLSQKLDAVGQLAAGVAHDFNNILTAIKGNAELLREGCSTCGTLAAEVGEINQAADRASSLTGQLLAFSRKQVLKPRVLELDALVGDLKSMLERLLPENVRQDFQFGAANGLVNADPGQLEQVIVNLVVNARDAMPLGGAIVVRSASVVMDHHDGADDLAMTPGAYVRLTVSDTGVGMDERTRERLFEPFFTTKERGKGTGLGLSTVYGIVKQAGGYIFVDTKPQAGTTFTIYLPRVDGVPEESKVNEAAAAPKNGQETILVVEDEPAIRRILSRTLERTGYKVLMAESGTDALAVVRDHAGHIDLLITDVIMPGLSGAELAAHLTRARRGLRVLYISGYAYDKLANHGVMASGGAQLLERVRGLLDADRSRAA